MNDALALTRRPGSWSQLSRALIVLAFACLAGPLAAQPTSIQDFMAREPQFGELVGSTFRLEGRASTLSGNELRMKGTELKFIAAEPLERPRKFPHVQIVGRLEREGRDFHVVVLSLTDYKPEVDAIKDHLRAGDTSDPDLYFDEAAWAERRAKFYDDPMLNLEAARLRVKGIEIARIGLAPDAAVELRALVDKAAQWGLDQSLRMDLLHAATWAEMRRESKNRQPAYATVLNNIRTRFPGAEKPLSEYPRELAEKYLAKPEETYAAADEAARSTLQRLLYIEAAVRLAGHEANADGSNGSEVAATLERLAPERSELAATFRKQELDYLESRVPTLDRAGVLELRNKLRAAGQDERARRAVRQWIDLQLSRRPNRPETDVDRAQMEFEMVEDEERALSLLSAALRLDPKVTGGAELLSMMGYGWHEGKAVRKELIPAPPPDPFTQAVEEGRILVGMTVDQVRAALGGAPESIVRMASQGRVTELWHYPSQRITLHFAATRQKPELEVSRIVELGSTNR